MSAPRRELEAIDGWPQGGVGDWDWGRADRHPTPVEQIESTWQSRLRAEEGTLDATPTERYSWDNLDNAENTTVEQAATMNAAEVMVIPQEVAAAAVNEGLKKADAEHFTEEELKKGTLLHEAYALYGMLC